ncbi:MAG: 1-acyl-sn-glycerol-3-phosphate acyltransferase [Balneolaceae bacterium]|nr:1-acyl-sn-glycerol-3-phosphate acyltransferase [Balneolaceae bacterium]
MRNNYLWYQFFRYGLVKPALHLFYSDYSVSATQYIPQDKPVIFVANHQNSFIDALHVVCNTRKFMHFLTRAEPFEVPLVSHFLRSLNMMPVYRMRDGFRSVKKTEDTINKCCQLLGEGGSILVFAEANHAIRRRVRPLSKGFTRIAFGAEQQHNWQLDLQIQPVGLNYSHHQKARTPFHIQFGEPIAVGDFQQTFIQNERIAAQELKQATAKRLSVLTTHVSNLEHYPLHRLLLDELEPNRQAVIKPSIANKRIATIENGFDEADLKKANRLLETCSQHHVNIHDLVTPVKPTWRDFCLSPLYLFSLINNILPYQAVRWITEEYIEDHVFDSSVKFVMGLFLLPLLLYADHTALEFVKFRLAAVGGILSAQPGNRAPICTGKRSAF